MGIFSRIKKRWQSDIAVVDERVPVVPATSDWLIHDGSDDLEVVGEASYQTALWELSRSNVGEYVRREIVAVLKPEPGNEHDPNAIAVHVDEKLVGYLPRRIAVGYLPFVQELIKSSGKHVALRGVIVGGGVREDGLGRLGVWLKHDSEAFGAAQSRPAGWVRQGARVTPVDGVMRTGFTEAWRTDDADDSYDLSWFSGLPEADQPAIAMLRVLLVAERDPIDRHYQFVELEQRLYKSRDLYVEALVEFDAVCRSHDEEMGAIRKAFMCKWGTVPLIETYRQMAIRKSKVKDWQACKWWAERGLEVYGRDAAREDAVEDLIKRRNRAIAKIEAELQASGPREPSQIREVRPRTGSSRGQTGAESAAPVREVLVCSNCDEKFERVVARGRKPRFCDVCRSR